MFDEITKSNNRFDEYFIKSKKEILIGMTKGSIENTFTLDKINAATLNIDNE